MLIVYPLFMFMEVCMKKKIIVFSNYGGLAPDVVIGALDKKVSMLSNRSNQGIIEKLEKNAVVFDSNIHTEAWFKKNCEALVFYSESGDDKKDYLGYNKEHNMICHVSIVSVDTSKRWYIDEYDGAEEVQYIKDMICADKELNYWVRRVGVNE